MAVCNIGFEHFTLEEESGFPSPLSGPIKPVPVKTMENKIVGDIETTFKIQPPIDSPKKNNGIIFIVFIFHIIVFPFPCKCFDLTCFYFFSRLIFFFF